MSTSALDFYRVNYDLIRNFTLADFRKTFLHEGQTTCRFCKKMEHEVSFRNKAHAIPESFGNKTLFTKYECDGCGNFFSETIENDFGNYYKPYRTLARIRGKNRVPSIKNEAKGWRIELDASGLNIQHRRDDTLVERDIQNKTLRFKIPRDPYTPVGVFKCFVKMALSIVPEVEMGRFSEAIEWIMNSDHSYMPLSEAILYETVVDGVFPFRVMSIWLFRRKRQTAEVPYMMFVIAHANSSFQISIPCPQMDANMYGKEVEIMLFPTPYHFQANSDRMVRKVDLSRTAPERDVAQFEMHFDSYSVTKQSVDA